MFRPSTSRVPLHGSSSFDATPARAAPLSPPETELEPTPPALPANDSYGSDFLQAHSETPGARFRRVAYNTSSSLSNREQRAPPRQTKWLITVVPPATLTEPPVLGHTLSSAPTGRFSHGILVPLFPTLYGQLTAIAREFNIPSTTGLCIYLQIQENGVPMLTPRVSDETWQILWGHYFIGDDRLPSHGLPIAGRIEFDVDLRRAKWFNAWMGIPARSGTESEVGLSREPSLVHSHWRGESRSSALVPEQTLARDESPSPQDPTPTLNQPFRAAVSQRQVPRPLLLERRDAVGSRSFSRPSSRGQNLPSDVITIEQPAPSTLTEPTFVPKTLSPMVQELEEPATAKPTKKTDVDTLVMKWRENSITGGPTSAISAAGQPSLDAINMPSGAELDLDDFAWSISSAGPPSESPISLNWQSPLPSVHLHDRMAGSVCLTPTTCTSWGPPSYPQSPVSSASRQPSVDLGQRMEEFVPLTPTTATSWGPPSYPQSPISFASRRPSIDLGQRMEEFAPLTPSTATSWGPEDLHSPYYYQEIFRPPSVDIGLRGMGSVPVTPSTATSWGRPDTPLLLPPTPQYVRTPDAGERSFPDFELPRSAPNLSFPYYDAWTTQPWMYVWPYQSRFHPQPQTGAPGEDQTQKLPQIEVQLDRSSGYPTFDLYPAVYPYNLQTIYPAVGIPEDADNLGTVEVLLRSAYPALEIYASVYPFNLDSIYPAIFVSRISSPRKQSREKLPEFPDFANLYPADPKAELVAANKRQPVCDAYDYPFIKIYSSVYPYNLGELYPPTSLIGESQVKSQPVALQTYHYPHLVVYPAVYPFNLEYIYAPINSHRSVTTHVQQSVKVDNTVVASVAGMSFPYYDAWNAKPWEHIWPYQTTVVSAPSSTLSPEYPDFAGLYPEDPHAERIGQNKAQSVSLHELGYPFLNVYQAVYPYSVYEIYGQSTLAIEVSLPESKKLVSSRSGSLPEYPDFAGLYPKDPSIERVGMNKAQSVVLSEAGYPYINVYPAVYPYSVYEIYGSSSGVDRTVVVPSQKSSLPEYPDFCGLYPEDPRTERVGMNKAQSVALLEAEYPYINVYHAVYPYSVYEIYGPSWSIETELKVDIPFQRRSLPEYPDFCGLYPEDSRTERVGMNKAQTVALPKGVYPYINVYPVVYPYSVYEIYGPSYTVDREETVVPSQRSLLPEYPDFAGLYPKDPRAERVGRNKAQSVVLSEAGYPYINVYPAVYPYSIYEIYGPSFSIETKTKVVIPSQRSLLSEYPDFCGLYPEDPHAERVGTNKAQSVVLSEAAYPYINVYPAVYPYSVYEIYGASYIIDLTEPQATVPSQEGSLPEYPDFCGLFPEDPRTERVGMNKAQPVALPNHGYPDLTVYPSVYPHNIYEIYGPSSIDAAPRKDSRTRIEVGLPVYQGYPVFNIYPAPSGYPTFEIYPPIALAESSPLHLDVISVKLPSSYPALQIYEPVYPHLVIYPPVVSSDEVEIEVTLENEALPCLYPTIQIYKPVYPHFDLYPPVEVAMPWKSSEVSTKLPALYPAIQLYESVYPHLVTYTPVIVNDGAPIHRKAKRTHHDLHAMVFGESLAEQNVPAYLPRRKPMRTHHDLHMMVLGAQAEEQKAPVETSQPVYMPRKQPKRTHRDLHMMVFGSQMLAFGSQLELSIKETLAKFPMPPMPPIPLPPTPPTPPARSARGRSGTVTQRPATAYDSLHPLSTLDAQTPSPTRPSPSGSRPIPSPFTNSPSRSSSTRVSPISPGESSSSTSPSHLRPSSVKGLPYSPSQTRSSLVGLPPSPSSGILSRVRSMRDKSTVSQQEGGLDRSKSMTEATLPKRRSIVQDRARLFSGGDLHRHEDEPPTPSRPVSKLDRSKIPFS
ncbi:hypothetical protein M422DRAFT_218231 [Sphaerobolus stellatus SS14]|nr:hypothetical protein M422DRAFT_218231 [Sphaerobolus stellatus SS14]